MSLELKFRKSAGVPVTTRVHRLLVQGNRARGGDWAATAAAYRAALALDPSLRHIWIQLGHALAEAGRYEEAIAAYAEAARRAPDQGEPWLHMGHTAKRAGQRPRATRFYLAAMARSGVENEAAEEAGRLVQGIGATNRETMRRLGLGVREDGGLPARDPAPSALAQLAARAADPGQRRLLAEADAVLARVQAGGDAAQGRPVVFDVTDLVAHFRHQRLPTGIQRVQIEVILRALTAPHGDRVSICCFVDGRDHWIGIATALFIRLSRLASSGSSMGDAEWQAAAGELFLSLAIDDHFAMPDRAILVNLGTSWWIFDYFRMVREAKAAHGISYVPFVHDFIPIVAPEHCVRGVTEDYTCWAVGVFNHADRYLVNSQSTGRDLRRVAARLGHAVGDEDVEVVPLDADFRRATAPLPAATLDQWGIGGGLPYALLVSTIESRKNHALAFDTWAKLIDDHGADAVPQLVCVGRRGWLYDLAFERLDAHPGLAEKVTLVSQVSDAELALIYAHCRFTVYPSHYEGWGLPITESLCYGKLPIVADNSSLPEAGAGFAVTFVSDSIEDFARAVTGIAFDDARRLEIEARIARDYRPRGWDEIAAQIQRAIEPEAGDGARPVRTVSREIQPGRYYPIRVYREPEIWPGLASGEIFRAGDGWFWPDAQGCLTKPGGAELRFTLAQAIEEPRFYLHLAGLVDQPVRFAVRCGDATVLDGRLKAGESRWAAMDLPRGVGDDIAVRVECSAAASTEVLTGGTLKRVPASIRVHGFALVDGADEEARTALLEVIALGDPETISAYRRREDAA